MDIELYEFQSTSTQEPTLIGLNISKKFGLTNVNLFALAENKGSPISHHLWGIANDICNNILTGEKPENLNWTLTTGGNQTSINYHTLNGVPLKISVSDQAALQWERMSAEQHANYDVPSTMFVKSLNVYAENYDGQPPIDVSKVRERSFRPDPRPMTMYTIPTQNSKAKDGVIYCGAEYSSQSAFDNDHEVLLVDTKKLLVKIAETDPAMIDHAVRKYRNDSPDYWAGNTSMEQSISLGTYSCRDGNGLNFTSGYAGVLCLIQDLNLPYVPISVAKSDGAENIARIRNEIGIGKPATFGHAPDFRL
jgi:hypothetical protein